MDKHQLSEIEARAEAATSGPWRTETDERTLSRLVRSEDATLDIDFGYVGNRTMDDAQFVAHARTDVPALVAEVKRLKADVDHAIKLMEHAVTARDVREGERDRVRSTAVRLEQELAHKEEVWQGERESLVAELATVRNQRDRAMDAIERVQTIAEAMQDRAGKTVFGDSYEQGQKLMLDVSAKEILAALVLDASEPADREQR